MNTFKISLSFLVGSIVLLSAGALYSIVYLPNSSIQERALAGYATPISGQKDITLLDASCRKITSTTSTQYFVPTRTQAESDAFLANPPSGVSAGACGAGPACGTFTCFDSVANNVPCWMNFRNQLDTWQTQGYLTAQQNTDIRNAGSTAWDATCQRTYNGTLPLGSLIVERLVNISPVSARFNLDTEEFGNVGGCTIEMSVACPTIPTITWEYGCFIGGTKITLKDGTTKDIEEIGIGEYIRTYDEISKNYIDRPVVEVFHHEKKLQKLYSFYFNNRSVTSNHIHMIYLPVEDRYMSAELIYKRWKNGESIYFLDAESNSPAKIENILFREEVVPVYNLHVSSVYDRNNSHIDTTLPNHNYMANGIVVHNRKAPNTFDDAVSLYNAYKNRCTNVGYGTLFENSCIADGTSIQASDGTYINGVVCTGTNETKDIINACILQSLSPPQNLAGTAGNASVSLTWTAPSSGTPTDYIIEYKATSSATWLTFVDGVSTAVSATVTSLTNGTSYDFRVKAKYSSGDSGYTVSITKTPILPDTGPCGYLYSTPTTQIVDIQLPEGGSTTIPNNGIITGADSRIVIDRISPTLRKVTCVPQGSCLYTSAKYNESNIQRGHGSLIKGTIYPAGTQASDRMWCCPDDDVHKWPTMLDKTNNTNYIGLIPQVSAKLQTIQCLPDGTWSLIIHPEGYRCQRYGYGNPLCEVGR